MNEKHKDFSEQLLKAEQINLSYREKYEKDLQAILEPKLSGIERMGLLAAMVFSLVMGIFLLIVGLSKNAPLLPRLAILWGSLFSLLMATYMGLIAVRGSQRMKTEETFFSVLGLILGVGMFMFMLDIAPMYPDPMKGVRLIASGFLFLFATSVVFIVHNIHLAKIEIREKLLEMEYRLAEISEQLTKK